MDSHFKEIKDIVDSAVARAIELAIRGNNAKWMKCIPLEKNIITRSVTTHDQAIYREAVRFFRGEILKNAKQAGLIEGEDQ